MSKYIYGKYNTDTYPDELINEFHFLCMYLGAYLRYCKDPKNYESFNDYAQKNNLFYKENDKFYWCYINEAQAFLRDKINENIEKETYIESENGKKTKYISKRQIRKLGYSGFFSVPMFPKKGIIIEQKLFQYIFEEKNLSSVKDLFIDYISKKWKNDKGKYGYLKGPTSTIDTEDTDLNNCIRRTAINFCGFQEDVLQKVPQIRREFQSNNTYEFIQHELEMRK